MKEIKDHDSGILSWVSRFLLIICPDDLLEEIEGDLLQRYRRDENMFGKRRAQARLLWNALRFFRPGIFLRKKFSLPLIRIYMLKSYFKIAYRQLGKSKLFALFNVCGLSIGFTAFFLLSQYVSFELSYDDVHQNKDLIYRIGLERAEHGEFQRTSAKTFAGIRSLLQENFPEVDSYTGFYKTPANTGFLFRYKNKIYNEPGGVLNPDSAFFSVFPSLLLRGDPATALREPNHLVISETIARKIFGTTDPLGKHIERIDDYENGSDFVVTGILKDLGENSHFHASFLRQINDSWPDPEYWKSFLFTYITISNGSSPHRVEERLNALLRKLEGENSMIKDTRVFLQPLGDIHLSSHFADELEHNGSTSLLFALGFTGLVIMVIAWINYINLETARFVLRTREVGVRRIIGSRKSDVIVQCMVEYGCLALAALAMALVLLAFIAPEFSALTGIPVHYLRVLRPETWIIEFLILAAGSVAVGSYPALFLLRLKPVEALKGSITSTGRRWVRHPLVIVQFTVSLILIAFVLVIHEQIEFMRLANKKIDIERVLALRNPTAYSNQDLQSKHNDYKVFQNKLLQSPDIERVASSSAIPGQEIGFSYINLIKRTLNDSYDPTVYKTLFMDGDFIPTYDLKIIAGNNFESPEFDHGWIEPWEEANWNTILLNETAARQLGFHSAEEAIGETVNFQLFDDFQKYNIIGVVEDYHHEAIKNKLYPTIFARNYSTFQQVYYSIRFKAGTNLQRALGYVEESWKSIFPGKPFEYFFMDDYYDQQFKSEIHFKSIFSLFAITAIFLASLGILGMALFEANSRLKEISIRKILGASAGSLLFLLSREHLKVVLLAVVISVPLIYVIAVNWLSHYPERVAMDPLFFLIPFGVVMGVVTVISIYQTIKADHTNPLDHIKNA